MRLYIGYHRRTHVLGPRSLPPPWSRLGAAPLLMADFLQLFCRAFWAAADQTCCLLHQRTSNPELLVDLMCSVMMNTAPVVWGGAA